MNLANRISILRILLVPFFILSLIYYTPEKDILRWLALLIFSLAVVTDAVDGYVARIFGQKTTLGTFLDPLADKFLLISAFICLTLIDFFPSHIKLPPWALIIVISRDVIIVLGTILIYIITQHVEIIPSRLGKVATFFQMITIISLLLQFKHSDLVWSITMFFTIVSGINYIRRGSKLFNNG